MDSIACAALSGICARALCHPLDTVKTVSYTGFAGEGGHSRGFVAAAREIVAKEGATGFYRGVGVSCLAAAPGVALYLTSYEYARAGIAVTQLPNPIVYFLSGLVAEAVSCVVWVPSDVAKERLQSQPPSLAGRYRDSWDALRSIYHREGLAGMYKGYWSTLASFGPFSAVYFVCYEFFCAQLQARAAPTDSPAESPSSAPRSPLIALAAGAGGNIVASLCTNPFELVKTRLQVQRAVLRHAAAATAGGAPAQELLYTYHYRGLLDGIASIARNNGVRALWAGVGSRIAYTAPNAALTMSFFECFKSYVITPTSKNSS